ncbi:MAG: hypothetical protein ACTSQI_12315 [Candidatus Helarchaeota archaeon]
MKKTWTILDTIKDFLSKLICSSRFPKRQRSSGCVPRPCGGVMPEAFLIRTDARLEGIDAMLYEL